MYKKQMTAQRILCLAAIIVSAIFFLYSLGIMTDLYDSLYDTMRNPSNPFQTDVEGSIVYYNMQEFNRMFLMLSIVQLLLGALLFITNTHSRRKYYIGNYVATGLFVAGGVYNAVFATSTSKSSRLSFSRWTSPPSRNTLRCGARCTPSPPSGSTCTMPCSAWCSSCALC